MDLLKFYIKVEFVHFKICLWNIFIIHSLNVILQFHLWHRINSYHYP